MKEMIGTVLALLRKYNRLWVVILAISVAVVLFVTAIVLNDYELLLGVFILALMCAWEISDVFLFQKHDNTLVELANIKDKLVLVEHEADRLTLELEVTQTALLNAKSPKIKEANESKTKEATAPDAVDIQPRPKAKKSSSQRKPKPKQTGEVNENKN